MKCKYENVLTYYNFCNRECYYCTFDQKERCKMKHPEYFGEDKNAVKVFEVKKMTTKEMIETLRYKANNIKAKIEPEFFNEVADRLEIQVAKEPLDVNIVEKDSFYRVEFICSNCEGAVYGQPYKPNNCKHCGQKILWKGEADENKEDN